MLLKNKVGELQLCERFNDGDTFPNWVEQFGD
jgi:hypothetical protein